MIKRTLIVLLSVLAMAAEAQEVIDWENPAVLGINKLPYHATLQMPSKEAACQEIRSLDGRWLFHWSKAPETLSSPLYSLNSVRRFSRRNRSLNSVRLFSRRNRPHPPYPQVRYAYAPHERLHQCGILRSRTVGELSRPQAQCLSRLLQDAAQ